MTALRSQIATAIADRLATVTAANGYETDVKKVYYDKIPMGLRLQNHQMPAIYMLRPMENRKMEQGCMWGEMNITLQIWDVVNCPDSQMDQFERDVYKALYANSPVAEMENEFRSIHTRIVELVPGISVSDLQLLDANRIYQLSFVVRYRTKLYNL